ncbi:hypothetical protein AXW38_09940 [Yersinia ruckeri]|uniref:hypothetical protein n=1 Tax=Yersinia ruckeri TaxID=29486 RepID=UPI0004E415E5|nr:hypothetical protein [Yersinia ruckeri]ARZ01322.1 hypothetical protein QMA0440_01989 [Yersinia ruckeri]EKN4700366.1 hypothetical protein [Yersinia ruckeri]ELM3740235.1 hypothetical protein [Yersinia ruckeri]KFE37333.1 hypothetical protein nADLYRO1b_3292 [Yersinia ruckeri]MCW6563892.1 hypothetical protein [Yersinia ruckeri]
MLMTMIAMVVGLLGAGLVSFGAWLLAPAAGFITAGMLCLLWSFFAARAVFIQSNESGRD